MHARNDDEAGKDMAIVVKKNRKTQPWPYVLPMHNQEITIPAAHHFTYLILNMSV